MRKMVGWVVLALIAAWTATPAAAQSGAEVLIEPWPEGARAQSRPSLQLWQTHTKGVDAGVRFGLAEGASRYRLHTDSDHSPTLGYQAYLLRITSDDPVLPRRLADLSLGTAVLLRDEPDWQIAVPLGVGFAGTRPFSDSRAWYGRVSLLSSHRLDERSQLLLGLDYHGNRTLLPDLPLPGAAYVHDLDDTLTMTLGLPYSALQWQPDERWQVQLSYTLLTDFDAEVQYQATEAWSFFAAFDSQRRAFHRHGDPRHRRLFFQQRRAELGARWQVLDRVEALAAGGYTFGGKLSHGFDVRDLDTLRRFGNAPYLRLGLSSSF